MDKPPMEWIDKLFTCMTEFYGDRWTKKFDSGHPVDLYKAIWQSALTGLVYDEIRCVLVLLKQSSKSYASNPPTQLEFYRSAKNPGRSKYYHLVQNPGLRCGDPSVARKALDEINDKLKYRIIKE